MITVDHAAFRKAALLASSVIYRRNSVPVLGMLKVVANGSLALEATDLDIAVRAQIPYEGEAGEFLLDAPDRVLQALKHSAGDVVSFGKVVDENNKPGMKIACGMLEAVQPANRHVDDHPGAAMMGLPTFTAKVGEDFLRQLSRIMPAISTEETRYYLNGIHVHKVSEWTYRFVATDGHRLMFVDIPLPDATGELPESAIIPRAAIRLVLRSFARAPDGVTLQLGQAIARNDAPMTLAPDPKLATKVQFSAELGGGREGGPPATLQITSKLIDGRYPEYQRVLPPTVEHVVQADRRALIRAVRAAAAMKNERFRAVTLGFPEHDRLTIAVSCADLGTAVSQCDAQHKLPADFKIGFNGEYLIDALDALRGETVEIRLTDPAAPVVIVDPTDTAFTCVQMPMQV